MDDGHRHQHTIVALDEHLFRLEVFRGAVGPGSLQPGVDELATPGVERVIAKVARPRAYRDQQPWQPRVGRTQLDRAFARQQHRFGFGTLLVRDTIEFADGAVARLNVQRVLGGAHRHDDLAAGRDHHFSMRGVGVRHAGLENLEARRILVRQEIKVVAMNRETRHIGFAAKQLAPLHVGLERISARCDVDGQPGNCRKACKANRRLSAVARLALRKPIKARVWRP